MAHRFGTRSLPGYVLSTVTRVQEATGYPIVVTEEHGFGHNSLVRMANRRHPCHQVSYTPGYREFAAHFLVNACWKIQRMWAEPEPERLVPVKAKRGDLPGMDYLECCRRLIDLGPGATAELSKLLYECVVQQLTSTPTDLRVERELHRDLPEHRPAQWRYLRRQLEEFKPTLAPDVAEFVPEHVYAAITAMNVVQAEEAGEITGERPNRHAREDPYRKLSDSLRSRLHAEPDPGHRGDRHVIDAWSQELGLQGWFEWLPLDYIR